MPNMAGGQSNPANGRRRRSGSEVVEDPYREPRQVTKSGQKVKRMPHHSTLMATLSIRRKYHRRALQTIVEEEEEKEDNKNTASSSGRARTPLRIDTKTCYFRVLKMAAFLAIVYILAKE
ncbi:hypothetical protein B0H13DRAFT_1883309 [Mycena leptocephala]|nr:hypothetical protein B0H13DRAFT_1883309 [Mycena leptocephala]